MPNATLSIGDASKARCTKCRKNTDHTIVAMAEEKPDKVQCLVCNRQHKYRPPTVPRKSGVKRSVDPRKAEREEWQTLRPGMDSAEAREYSMTGVYPVNALIRHPVFGLGLVRCVVGAHRIEVLFEDGKKTMRCK